MNLVAQLAASLTAQLPDAHCRVGRQWEYQAHLRNLVEMPARLNDGVADRLSPSQVSEFLDCQAKWYFHKVLGLPEAVSSNLSLGRAVHAALAENFRQKIETKEDLPGAGVQALFTEAWTNAKDETTWAPDNNAEDLENAGKVMIQTYMDQVAPRIEPAAVEFEVSGLIAGVPVLGYVDLMDVNGTIIDVKTAKKKPVGVRVNHRLQVATYRQLAPGASGVGKVDTLVKGSKTIGLHEQTFEVNEADIKSTAVLYPAVQEAMRSGLYMPNRGSYLCSRRNCSFWSRCEEEYGGQVASR